MREHGNRNVNEEITAPSHNQPPVVGPSTTQCLARELSE